LFQCCKFLQIQHQAAVAFHAYRWDSACAYACTYGSSCGFKSIIIPQRNKIYRYRS
jgi:hypothetical protein